MTTMLVIDTTTRALLAFTANVTRGPSGLVVREAMHLGDLGDLASPSPDGRPTPLGDLPILLIGDGYQSRSSAGFVEVRGHQLMSSWPIVGWMQTDRPLRVIRPRIGRLFVPAELKKVAVATNSNPQTADAARAGAALLANSQRRRTGRRIIISEGQSDWVRTFVLELPEECSLDWDSLHKEHQAERFAPESLARTLFRAAYNAARRDGYTAPVAMARGSLRRSAERVVALRPLVVWLGQPYSAYGQGRLTTWEVDTLLGREGVWEEVRRYPHIPLSLAQAAELAALDPESEEYKSLANADARTLDLPLEDWERELLAD